MSQETAICVHPLEGLLQARIRARDDFLTGASRLIAVYQASPDLDLRDHENDPGYVALESAMYLADIALEIAAQKRLVSNQS